MTIKQLAAKKFAGIMNHPVCQIIGCFNEDLHDILLTKDGGVYLVCKDHAKEYLAIMQTRNVKKYRRLREQFSANELSAPDFEEKHPREIAEADAWAACQ